MTTRGNKPGASKALSRAKHEAILEYLVAHPTATLRELSAEFGLSRSWLSTLINSAAFRDRLEALLSGNTEAIAIDMRARLEGVAQAAIERIAEELDRSPEPRYALDVADKVLARLGWGRAPAPSVANTQVNIYSGGPSVDPSILARARAKLEARTGSASAPLEGEIISAQGAGEAPE